MEENLDTLHGSILLKANYSVNRSADSKRCAPYGGFGSTAHAVRHVGMMGVKDYVHF